MNMKIPPRVLRAAACVAMFVVFQAPVSLRAQAKDRPLPRIVQKDGRFALFVDGTPFFMLGAQINNSSAWPAMLSKVWPAIETLHANTVEMPVYWEQFEPEQARFDYTIVDTLLAQAREHRVHLVLLWFGTWKNGSSHYMPERLRLDLERAPHVIDRNGHAMDSPSPYSKLTLDADIHAFTALMTHLKLSDSQHTVIMVQVENEAGTWGGVRDYSPTAQKLFEAPVPAELLAALHKQPAAGSNNWQAVFGDNAEEFFHAWSVARYIGQVAAAGKAVYPLPLYANAALRDPLSNPRPPAYESGGPTDNVIPIWKVAAPALDLVAPDIYMNDSARYFKVLDLYQRPDNALFVPETGRSPEYARYLFAALGRQAIGFSPFGMDYTRYSNSPTGAASTKEEAIVPFAHVYSLIYPIDRQVARLNFEGKVQAVAEEKDTHTQSLDFGAWTVSISYGLPQFGAGKNPAGNPDLTGGALVGQLGENQFLVTGLDCRLDFRVADATSGKQRQYLRVEEGTYEGPKFHAVRIWNGDQTDWGLNFSSAPQVLRVTLTTY